VPPVRLAEAGRLREDLIDLLALNTRNEVATIARARCSAASNRPSTACTTTGPPNSANSFLARTSASTPG
jgi:hypothetical protein